MDNAIGSKEDMSPDDRVREALYRIGYSDLEADVKIAVSKLIQANGERNRVSGYLNNQLQTKLLDLCVVLSAVVDSRRLYEELRANQINEQLEETEEIYRIDE